MFDAVIYLLAKEHDRGLHEAADRSRLGRGLTMSSESARRRRVAAEVKLLRARLRRG